MQYLEKLENGKIRKWEWENEKWEKIGMSIWLNG